MAVQAWLRRRRAMWRWLLSLSLALALFAPLFSSPQATEASCGFLPSFPETNFCVANAQFYDYFLKRGGIRTFGLPISREFTLLGKRVQVFQRRVMELRPDGTVGLLNLLDPDLMPYTHINSATFPEFDEALTKSAPAVGSKDYFARVLRFVKENTPDTFAGSRVNYYQTFLNTVSLAEAYPGVSADPSSLPGLALEIWGIPTSKPLVDPNNHTFLYLRFQRGIMHFDATTGLTQGILLGEYFKAILTGVGLPADLKEQAKSSRFYLQYDNSKPKGIARPDALPDSDLRDAFEKEPFTRVTRVVVQQFERGWMIWREDTREVAVIFGAGGGRWRTYPDPFQEGEPETGGEKAPAGLFEPKRGFGKLWRSDISIRDALGWGLFAEFSAQGTFTPPTYGGDATRLMTDNRYYFSFGSTWAYATRPF